MKKKTNIKNDSAPFKFTVDLKKWRCGDTDSRYSLGNGDTALRNREGYMCCLGFACRAAGYKGRLTGLAEPEEINKKIPQLTTLKSGDNGDYISNSEFSKAAMTINDSLRTTVEDKIKKLKELGKKHNIEINFK